MHISEHKQQQHALSFLTYFKQTINKRCQQRKINVIDKKRFTFCFFFFLLSFHFISFTFYFLPFCRRFLFSFFQPHRITLAFNNRRVVLFMVQNIREMHTETLLNAPSIFEINRNGNRSLKSMKQKIVQKKQDKIDKIDLIGHLSDVKLRWNRQI